MNYRDFWKSTAPEGSTGIAEIDRFDVSESDAKFAGIRGEYIQPGVYTRLKINNRTMMSDTPKEFRDHYELFRNAKGHVLLNGLGLGCCLNVVLNKPEVDRVTVIENSEDVIALVANHFPDAEIIQSDAFSYTPPAGVRYGAVWHDIWRDICEDNLPEMHKLHRKYGRKTDWQGSWSRAEVEYRKRQSVSYF